MAEKGQIDLRNLKARYSIEDIYLVDSRKLESANECRLYFEISFGIGFMFGGALLSTPFNIYLLITTMVFMLFGSFFLWRYIQKSRNLFNRKGEEIYKKIKETEKACPKCGASLVIKEGKFGKFYGCSNFPNCDFTQDFRG
ncbi:topoisomerase DNA-binding C4 zinc finger domain-containing protein [Patescibacteria group bacterium]|nr:topoisomerase DNA-binding C4 zinc finger domain-containing protein [Patescibacteria group bacterium]